MAINYSKGNGLLVLKKITPTIEALFGDLGPESNLDEKGEVSIANMSQETDLSWGNIAKRLKGLIDKLQLSLPDNEDDEEPGVEEYLYVLASHFKQDRNFDFDSFIEHRDIREESCVNLGDLFDLARLFDDGHGLTAIRFETAFVCSDPLLFEFGGCGEYYGKNFRQISASNVAATEASAIDLAIGVNDFERATTLLTKQVNQLLMGVTNEHIRKRLQDKVAEKLTASL